MAPGVAHCSNLTAISVAKIMVKESGNFSMQRAAISGDQVTFETVFVFGRVPAIAVSCQIFLHV
jgi:hypothetical protein